MELLQLFSFFLQFLSYHRIIFFNLVLEVFFVSQSFLNLFLQISLVLNLLIAVRDELFRKFFDLFNLFLKLLDSFTFDFDHFFEIVALNHQIRNGFLIMSFIPPADFYQNI